MFLFVNVRGLSPHDKEQTISILLENFNYEGYTVQQKVLNAWDYGVSQKRERLILVGIRNDLVNKTNFEFPLKLEYKPILRDILLDCPPSAGSLYSKAKTDIFKLVPPGWY